MARAVSFTKAQVRRAVEAAESAGLRVKRVTVKPDGSIVVDSGESGSKAVDGPERPLPSWEDA